MPGYKGHLVGGCIAYGLTLALVLSFFPQALIKGTFCVANVVPSIVSGIQSAFGFYAPSLIKSAKASVPTSLFSLFLLAEWLVCALAGALFPDIDTKSKGQKWLYWILFIVFIALIGKKRYDLISFLAILALLPMLVNHRGLFHKAWFVILFPLGACFWLRLIFPTLATALLIDTLFFIAGACSHLWLDLGLKKMVRF